MRNENNNPGNLPVSSLQEGTPAPMVSTNDGQISFEMKRSCLGEEIATQGTALIDACIQKLSTNAELLNSFGKIVFKCQLRPEVTMEVHPKS